MRAGQAIAWAFKAVLRNPLPWIGYALIFGYLGHVSAASDGTLAGAVSTLAVTLLLPIVIAAAVEQTYNPHVVWPRRPAYLSTLAMSIVVGVFFTLALIPLVLIALVMFGDADSDGALLAFLVMTVAWFLGLGPWCCYQLFFSADSYHWFTANFREALAAARRNYWPTFALTALLMLSGALAGFAWFVGDVTGVSNALANTLSILIGGFGFVLGTLALAHAYRQITDTPVTAP